MSEVTGLQLYRLYQKCGLLEFEKEYKRHPEQCKECHADEFTEFLTDGKCDNCIE